MPMIRAQYHFRSSERGLLAWDVRRLIELSKHLPVQTLSLADIRELDEAHWYINDPKAATCRGVVEHCSLILAANLTFPIILDASGGVMDGMHRVCKALLTGAQTIQAVRFRENPPPDFVGVAPEALPYDNE